MMPVSVFDDVLRTLSDWSIDPWQIQAVGPPVMLYHAPDTANQNVGGTLCRKVVFLGGVYYYCQVGPLLDAVLATRQQETLARIARQQ